MSGPSILRHSLCTEPTLVKKRWPPMSKRNPLYSTVRAMPPTCPSFSRTMGERPRRARTYAAVSPAGPPPMTTCFRSDIKTRSRRPGADEHHEELRVIPQPIILHPGTSSPDPYTLTRGDPWARSVRVAVAVAPALLGGARAVASVDAPVRFAQDHFLVLPAVAGCTSRCGSPSGSLVRWPRPWWRCGASCRWGTVCC